MIDTLGDLLDNNARKFPNDIATVFGDRRISFAAHYQRARHLASALYRAGLRRQDRVAVLAQNCTEFLEVYGAAELSGYIVATVNFRLAPPEMLYILSDSTPRILVFAAHYAPVIETLRGRLGTIETFVCIGDEVPDWAIGYEAIVATGSDDGAPIRAAADDILHLIYTSGTTGRPKGVIRRHAAELRMADLMATEIGMLVSDRVQLMMPLFHIGSRALQMGAHLRGAGIVLHRAFDGVEVVRAIATERATISHMAPTMVQAMLDAVEAEGIALPSLHTICYSAAPMPVPVLRRGLSLLGPIFLQLYGSTEGGGTTLHKRQHRPDGSDEDRMRLGSVGQAAPDVDLRIVDAAGHDLPEGSVGEVLIRTQTALSGYWNNTAATLAALRDGWYHTGDLGRMDAQGFLYLVDRKKDMIISGGENIYSREVEEALASHPAVQAVAVIGVPDPHWGEAVRAVVVLVAGRQASEQELVAHCRAAIAGYKRPRSVPFTDALPVLPSGKINKVALRQSHGGGQASAPSGPPHPAPGPKTPAPPRAPSGHSV